MKKIIALFLAVVMCLSLAACGGENTDVAENSTAAESDTEELKDLVVGTWEIQFDLSDPKGGGDDSMELYKGGTGKGFASYMNEGNYHSIKWEIVDDVINIDLDGTGMFLTGYTYEDGVLTSVDGKNVYYKVD